MSKPEGERAREPVRPDGGDRLDVVVVGAATRDVAPDDPRGWRLGGGATYGALALARLGLRTLAVLGVDGVTATARELDLLRDAGAHVHLVGLEQGPVFENVETPNGRVQHSEGPASPMDPAAIRGLGAERARGWLLAPIAGELRDDWADAPPTDALVALGWQGILRVFAADGRVTKHQPEPSPLVRRADLVGLGRDDLAPQTPLAAITSLLRPAASLLVTNGAAGGVLLEAHRDGTRKSRAYHSIPAARVVDVTGAGDIFLATLFAARVEPRLIGNRGAGFDLLLAAAAASAAVEGLGLDAVPSRAAVRDRMRDALASRSGGA